MRVRQTTTERAILPTRPRLPGPLPAGLADPQAAGDPARTGGTAAGGTVGVVERQAREPPSAIRPGMGEHPAADEEEGLDRAAAQDDEAGGAGAWLRMLGLVAAGLLDRLGRDRGLWHTAGFGSGRVTPEGRHARVPAIVEQSRATAAGLILGLSACWYKAPMISGNIFTPASPSSPSMPPRLITSSTASHSHSERTSRAA